MKRILNTMFCLLIAYTLFATVYPQSVIASTTQQIEISQPPSDPASYQDWKSQLGEQISAVGDPSNDFSAHFVGSNGRFMATAAGVLSNDFLAYVVGSDGRFTMATTGGDPNNPNDDYRKLLYGHPSPWSSYTTLNIDGNISQYSPNSQPPTDDLLANNSSGMIGDIVVTQTLSIIHNFNTGRDDTVAIHYNAKNNGTSNHNFGIRIMLDTMLGLNDGCPFRIPGIGPVTTEMELTGNQIPEYWQAFDSLTNPNVTSQGAFYRSISERPDKVQFTNWSNVYANPWDYQVSTGNSFNNDTAVSMYWDPKTFAPGESCNFVSYYGLSSFSQDLRPPLALSVTGATDISSDQGRYSPNPFTVSAYVDNTSTGDASDVVATINLPEGLHLADGQSESTSLGTMPVGQEQMVSWQVQIDPSSTAIDLAYSVTVSASNTDSKTVTRLIHIPGIAQSKTVILIPGFMGTQLIEDNADGSSSVRWKPLFPNDVYRLALHPNGDSINTIYQNNPLTDYYETIEKQLRDEGYNVHTFGYDWRLDITENAQKLSDFIDNLGVDRVSIVAHSMGGLVATKYIADGHTSKIDKLITIGTPYLGAPKALYGFETGGLFEWYQNLVIGDSIKAISKNMTAAYELLPEAGYFTSNNTYYVSKLNGRWQEPIKFLSYDSTKNLILTRDWANANLIQKTEDFRNIDFESVLSSVDSYFIIGEDRGTIGKITESTSGVADLGEINGDGTVPIISANLGGRTESIHPNHTYYVPGVHSDLPGQLNVIHQVENILAGDSDNLAIGIERNITPMDSLKLKIECPVNVNVYDVNNQHLGLNADGTFDSITDNGSMYIAGDRKFVFLKDRSDFTVKMVGTSTGEMTYSLEEYDANNNPIKKICFDHVPLTSTTVIQTNTDIANGIVLKLDANGDGANVITVKPSVVLDAAGSQDSTPPILDVQLQGNKADSGWYNTDVSVTANAQDNLSGVNRIAYAINSSTTDTTYQKPFTLGEGKNHLDAVAIDNNENYSTPAAFDINIDKTPPTVTVNLQDLYALNSTPVAISYDATDALSGIITVQATLNGIPVDKGTTSTLTKLGTNRFEIVATDMAGNVQTLVKTFEVYLPVNLTIEPTEINLHAEGVVTAFVSLPSSYTTTPLANSINLNGVLAVKQNLTDPSHLVFKFSRVDLSKVISSGEAVPFTLTGYTGTYYFKGITKVLVK